MLSKRLPFEFLIKIGSVIARREYGESAGRFIAFDLVSGLSNVYPSFDSYYLGGQQILAATQTSLFHYDLRDNINRPPTLYRCSEWFTSPASHFDPIDIGLHQKSGGLKCFAAHGDGWWVCTGSSNGHLCIMDRRTGRVILCWRAHDAEVVHLIAWSRYQVWLIAASVRLFLVLCRIRSKSNLVGNVESEVAGGLYHNILTKIFSRGRALLFPSKGSERRRGPDLYIMELPRFTKCKTADNFEGSP